MSDESRPNFFLLLDLDPRARWDPAVLEQRISQKITEWSRQQQVPNLAREAKRNAALVPEIRKLMADDTLRQKEAADALQQSDQTRKEKLAKFAEALRISQLKGDVLEKEIANWVKEYAGVLTEAEIRSRITVKIVADAAPAAGPEGPKPLDPSKAKTIQDLLDFLHLKDLYAFVGLPRQTDTATLRARANELRAKDQSNSNKTAELDSRLQIAGEALDLFSSDEQRARYDETLRLAGLEAILAKYTPFFRAAGEVDKNQLDELLKEGRSAGWPAGEVLARVRALAKKQNWLVPAPDEAAIAEQQVCGNCGALNPPAAQYCADCKAQLKLSCPKCGAQVESDARACPACGFAVGNRYLVDSRLEEGRQLRAARKLDEAMVLATQAEQAWQGAKASDPRAQNIQQALADISAARQQQNQTLQRLRQLMDTERRFFEARTILDGLPAGTLADQDALRARAGAGISRAQALLAQARAQPQGSDAAVDLLQRALQECADYQEARDLLARNPPLPPTGQLTAKMGGAIVSLDWQPSPTKGALRYRVVRKPGAQPVSAQDGKTLATVAGTHYDDTNPETGVPFFYAVFTDREEVPSTQGVSLTLPVMFTPDVSGTSVKVNDQRVEMTWVAPPNVKKVLVTRKEGAAPIHQGDGTALNLLDLTHLTDANLRNDTTYYYRIACQYADHNGKERLSSGVTIEATPQVPPAPVTAFTITQCQTPGGREAALSWVAPPKGKVVAIRSSAQPKLASGAVVPEDQLRGYGQVLEGLPTSLTDLWPQAGIGYYTLVVVFQRMGYIGATQQFAAVDDVSDLKARNQGATVRLTWTWPGGCQQVIVATSPSAWPELSDQTVTQRPVDKVGYDRQGFFEIPHQQGADLFITVFAEMSMAGAVVHASGSAPGARARVRVMSKVSLEYEIKREKPLFGQAKLFLRLRPRSAAPLPRMLLRSKQYGLPFNKTDGEFITSVGPFNDPVESQDVPLEPKPYARDTFAKLFMEDDSDYEVVEVNHPTKERLRLDA